MRLPRYAEYRDSGAAWLGLLPVHWELLKVKHLVSSLEQGWSPQCESFPAETPAERGVMKVGCVNGGTFRPTENKKLPDDLQPQLQYALKRGDLLISRANTRDLVGSAAVVLDDYENLLLCDKLYRLRLRDGIGHATYLAQYLSSSNARSQIEVEASGASSSMLNIGQSTILELLVPLPSPSELTAIASFLDHETAKIDGLIAEQEKLIALLAEKRQATISHAVTRGLNPQAPMKDSGVPWLGEVPAHWEMKRLKNISPFITVGIVVNPSEYVAQEGLPFIYGGDITEGRIDTQNCRRITPEGSASQLKTRLQPGDLLTVRVGAPGITAVVPEECAGGNCASVMLIRKGECNSDWLCYAMNSLMVRFQVEVVQYGAAQEQFNISHAINFWVATPPISEQKDIALFLNTQLAGLEELSSQAFRGIELLKERRSALIAAAVTGQIDVRGFTAA